MEGLNFFKNKDLKSEEKNRKIADDALLGKNGGFDDELIKNSVNLEHSLEFRDNKISKLENELYDIQSNIIYQKNILKDLSDTENKKKNLVKQNLNTFLISNLEDSWPEETDIEKQIKFLNLQISNLKDVVSKDEITEDNILKLELAYQNLDKQLQKIKNIYLPENPSLN